MSDAGHGDNEFTENMIAEIRKYRHLYDTSLKEYKDCEMKDNSWTQISLTLAIDKGDLQKKWKNIRDSYSRILREQRSKPSGSAFKKEKPWPWTESLKFLKESVKHRKTFTNLDVSNAALIGSCNETDISTVDLDESLETSAVDNKCVPRQESSAKPVTGKQSRSKDLETAILEELKNNKIVDENDQFGNIVASQLKKMPIKQQSAMRIKILQCMHEQQFSSTLQNQENRLNQTSFPRPSILQNNRFSQFQ